jgi:glycerol-3-phosphate dehydrogenase (NAD(P)+)
MKFAILGGGSWGLALAAHLVPRHSIKMWEFFPDKALEMQTTRKSIYLTDATIDPAIEISSDLEYVLAASEIVLVVVPSDKVASTLERCKNVLQKQTIIICSKGFTPELQLLSVAARQFVQGEIYCLYGPTIADEVYKNQFTGMVLAGEHKNFELEEALEDKDLQIELSDDIIGVQIAAALKNILAIYIGMLDGMGLGENAKAYVITKGLKEIIDLGLKFGAKEATFYGLAGIGDIITTCFSEKSRNRSFGENIGKGKKLTEVLSEMNNVVEGLAALKAVHQISNEKSVTMPLIEGLYKIVFEGNDPLALLHNLD